MGSIKRKPMPEKPSVDRDVLLHRALADPSRVRILDALEAIDEPLDATQLAEAVGLHTNTVRSHLKQLESAGLVRAWPDAQGKPGRPHVLFELVEPRPLATAPDSNESFNAYRLLARVLAESAARGGAATAQRAELTAHAAGRALAEERAVEAGPMRHVVRVLARLGFDPIMRRPTEASVEIEMRCCPFEDLAPESLEIACAVHRGVIQGALGAEAEARAVELQPAPGSCVARLAAAS